MSDRARPGPDVLLGAGLTLAFALIAFLSTGGTSLGANTVQEIVLLAAGVLAAGLLLLWRVPAPRHGAGTFAAFALLAALTAASVGWSIQPEDSWREAARTLSYLAAFGSAVALARLRGERWAGLAGAVASFCTLLSAYALLVKVFPADFDQSGFIGRLSAPFDYWNATGVVAAMGLPATLWLGARRERARALRGLAAPAIALQLAVVVLSLSRSAAIAAAFGLAVWFALVPLRLRAVPPLAIGALGGAVISAYALATHALIHDRVPLGARVAAGHGFGVVLVLVLALVTPAGLAAACACDRSALRVVVRRRIGAALIASLALIPLGGVAALASSGRGFGGEVSHIWSSLTSTRASVSDTPGRLVALASTRPRYWSQGLKIAGHSLLHGVGALGYATARQRYSTPREVAGDVHAHSYAIETLADLGLLGVLINLALLGGWVIATRRTLGLAARDQAFQSDDPERAGLLTLLAVVVAYGVQSLVDWTWFIPGTTIPALVCAGWLAGRGRPRPRAPAVRLRLSDHPLRALALAGLLAGGLLAAWTIWQPLRSQQADAAAIAAAARGDTRAAVDDARRAAAYDPLSLEPHFVLSGLLTRLGLRHQAHAELVTALHLQPENPEAWRELGFWDLNHGRRHAAVGVLERALALDPGSTATAAALAQAQAAAPQAAAHPS